MRHPGRFIGIFNRNRVRYTVFVRFGMTAQVELVYICSSEMTTWFTLLDYDDSNKLHQNALLLVKRDLDAIPEDAVIDDRIKQPWPAAFLNRFGLES